MKTGQRAFMKLAQHPGVAVVVAGIAVVGIAVVEIAVVDIAVVEIAVVDIAVVDIVDIAVADSTVVGLVEDSTADRAQLLPLSAEEAKAVHCPCATCTTGNQYIGNSTTTHIA